MKIKVDNECQVEFALKKVSGRLIGVVDITMIKDAIDAFEARNPLSIRDTVGVRLKIYSKNRLPRKYTWTQNIVLVVVARCYSGWYLVEISRSVLYPGSAKPNTVILTEKQEQKVRQKLLQNFIVL